MQALHVSVDHQHMIASFMRPCRQIKFYTILYVKILYVSRNLAVFDPSPYLRYWLLCNSKYAISMWRCKCFTERTKQNIEPSQDSSLELRVVFFQFLRNKNLKKERPWVGSNHQPFD